MRNVDICNNDINPGHVDTCESWPVYHTLTEKSIYQVHCLMEREGENGQLKGCHAPVTGCWARSHCGQ